MDTYKAEVAERALELGVEIINDPSGLTFEPQLARMVSNHNAGLIVNHMRGRPETWAKLGPMPDPMATIGRDLDAAVSRARRVGIDKSAHRDRSRASGFGKRKEQNSLILGSLYALAALDLPILVGPSRKHFLAASRAGGDQVRHCRGASPLRFWAARTSCAFTTCAKCARPPTWRMRFSLQNAPKDSWQPEAG